MQNLFLIIMSNVMHVYQTLTYHCPISLITRSVTSKSNDMPSGHSTSISLLFHTLVLDKHTSSAKKADAGTAVQASVARMPIVVIVLT
ncbi:hypothetical protein A8C56_14330 [Niabella ginsenosidivorans]|uniref:Uncharacterized protein n=1 Tax=Niabella ginsenosidivorans TaxID=1176587 RepID=A0A1A9I4L4_9BACT|nr:hypothetical protein A8C56_14330 [Niabella ginsenosidivorans]